MQFFKDDMGCRFHFGFFKIYFDSKLGPYDSLSSQKDSKFDALKLATKAFEFSREEWSSTMFLTHFCGKFKFFISEFALLDFYTNNISKLDEKHQNYHVTFVHKSCLTGTAKFSVRVPPSVLKKKKFSESIQT